MNLTKLFETQKILRDRIGYNKEDRFHKLILSILVELGECANEVRCFKFWSHKPASEKSIILEEFVDGLHFILEKGLEINVNPEKLEAEINQDDYPKEHNITDQFLTVFQYACLMRFDDYYIELVNHFLNLGEMLGFTWEEVEQAYYTKNKINHQRQSEGY